ncbi:MAG: DUF134 domain-containing protein [Ignavibacteriaceae bacterium]|nr:DUF134 domain-containing protein [Ignavibacteriaceae bacterium]
MPRPKKLRRIKTALSSFFFKPQGIPNKYLEEVTLESDEVEALRLADLQLLSQEEGAAKMNISRATFGRIIAKAHYKIADSIINGKAISVSGSLPEKLKGLMLECKKCGFIKEANETEGCPKCSKERNL